MLLSVIVFTFMLACILYCDCADNLVTTILGEFL